MRALRTLTIAALVVIGGIVLVVLSSEDRDEAALDGGPAPREAAGPDAPMLVGQDPLGGGSSPDVGAPTSGESSRAAGLQSLSVDVVRLGRPERRITVEIQGTGEHNRGFHRRLLSDDAGRVVTDVPPGPYFVSAGPRPGHLVVGPWSKARRIGPFRSPYLARVSADVAPNADPAPARLELPGTTIRVRVVEAGTNRAIEGATVVAHVAVNPGHLVTGARDKTDARGDVMILDLLPGAVYGVNVLTEAYRQPEAQEVILDAEHLEHELVFELLQGGSLIVRLENDAGELQKISAALAVTVTREPSGAGIQRTWPHQITGKDRPTELRWERIAPGPHAISIQDAEEKAGTRYQPVDPVVLEDVFVRAGEATEVTLQVRYRAYVRLQGRTGRGTIDPHLRLTVRPAGEARVILGAPWQRADRRGLHHFDGYLAPGVYDIELKRKDGRTWQETLVVEREVIEKTLTAPWRD